MTNTLAIRGGTVSFRLDGPSEAPAVMLANSLGADLHMWDGNVPAFAARFRVLRYDMPGHGGSSVPAADMTPELLADDVVALLDGLGISRVHFVGVSLGGIVGQQLGARHGKRLLSLSLCNTMSKQAAPAMWAQRIADVRQSGPQAVVDSTIERWVTPPFAAANPQRMAQLREMMLRTSPEGYAACAAAVRDLQQTDLLTLIRVPALVLTGDQDVPAPPSMAQQMHALIAGSRLHVIEGSAHLSNINQSQEFDSVVLDFIASLERVDEERDR